MPFRLLIIGGGYVGTEVARRLENRIDVTLIEPREAFVHTPAMIRALVKPALIDSAMMPYDQLLKRGQVIRSRASAIHPGCIELANGDTLSGDIMLVATGSGHSGFLKPSGDSIADFRTAHADTAARIRQVGNIVVVGGGPVGIELAGEVAAASPEKRVTLVSATQQLLPGFPSRLDRMLRRKLAALGVAVVHGRADLVRDDSPVTGPLHLEGGRVIEADLILPATGSRGRNELLACLDGVRTTTTGRVMTDPWLRLPGHGRLFVGGDVAATGDAMTIVATMRQVPFLVKTLGCVIDGGDIQKLRPYRPWRVAPMLLPLGPRIGASFLPVPAPFAQFGVVGDLPTRKLKGSNLFIAKYRKSLRLDPAPVRDVRSG